MNQGLSEKYQMLLNLENDINQYIINVNYLFNMELQTIVIEIEPPNGHSIQDWINKKEDEVDSIKSQFIKNSRI